MQRQDLILQINREDSRRGGVSEGGHPRRYRSGGKCRRSSLVYRLRAVIRPDKHSLPETHPRQSI
jgi:hypothetical protein